MIKLTNYPLFMKGSKIFFKIFLIPFLFYLCSFISSCSSYPLHSLTKEDEDQEFKQKVSIQRLQKAPLPLAHEKIIKKESPITIPSQKRKIQIKKSNEIKKKKSPKIKTKVDPKIEEKKELFSRSTPYTQGEKLTYYIGYYNIFNAGTLTLEYPEKVNFNGKQAYYFRGYLKSNKLFSLFYSVNDKVEVWIDEQKYFAYAFVLNVDESKQKRKTKGLFNPKDNSFSFWETKVDKKGRKNTKLKWITLPLTQNVFSVLFYLRFLNFEVGKEYSTPVAHKGKNLIFKAKVLRKETLNTKVGKVPAWVLEPKVELDGVFKPMGKILLWVSADENKYLLKITSKIKIGKIHVSLKSIEVPH